MQHYKHAFWNLITFKHDEVLFMMTLKKIEYLKPKTQRTYSSSEWKIHRRTWSSQVFAKDIKWGIKKIPLRQGACIEGGFCKYPRSSDGPNQVYSLGMSTMGLNFKHPCKPEQCVSHPDIPKVFVDPRCSSGVCINYGR